MAAAENGVHYLLHYLHPPFAPHLQNCSHAIHVLPTTPLHRARGLELGAAGVLSNRTKKADAASRAGLRRRLPA